MLYLFKLCGRFEPDVAQKFNVQEEPKFTYVWLVLYLVLCVPGLTDSAGASPVNPDAKNSVQNRHTDVNLRFIITVRIV